MIDKVYLSEREQRERFKDKFAYNPDNGVYKLKADGCARKFDLTREEMHLGENENKIRNWECRNNAEYDEVKTQTILFNCFKIGYKLLKDESADDLIKRAVDDGFGEEIGYEVK